MKRLHITNGDVVVGLLDQSGLEGRCLAWLDILHEGPVPAGLSLDEMTRVRARFLSGFCRAGSYEEVLGRLTRRDQELKRFRQYEEVTLWFDHDLVDQLQLIQLLDWFARRGVGATRLALTCIGEYPGVQPFRGLGQLAPEQLRDLDGGRSPVGEALLALGSRAWEAFAADRPDRLKQLLEEDLAVLPFLRGALLRLLEEFPSTRDGLARSERQILEVLSAGPLALDELHRRSQVDPEAAPFMTDRAFLCRLADLGRDPAPLIRFEDGRPIDSAAPAQSHEEAELWVRRVVITPDGEKVRSGQADRVRFQDLDRWLGGLHLEGREPAWRWGHKRTAILEQRR